MTRILHAGSKEALDKGCICPVIDNHYGKGRPDGTFIYTVGCRVHNDMKEL